MLVANPEYKVIPHPQTQFQSFQGFYPFYLGEHRNPINRAMHLLGTSLGLVASSRVALAFISYILSRLPNSSLYARVPLLEALRMHRGPAAWWLAAVVVQAYTFAWVGHFFVEKNRPATFKYPVYSLRGDLKMLYEVITLQRKAI